MPDLQMQAAEYHFNWLESTRYRGMVTIKTAREHLSLEPPTDFEKVFVLNEEIKHGAV